MSSVPPERLRRFRNIAHRGASGLAPENTLASYDLALNLGAHYLELDLRLTGDAHPVVIHDATLRRIARKGKLPVEGLVSSHTLGELQELDIGSWFNDAYPDAASEGYPGLRVVTLEEVLLRYRHLGRFCIELKDPLQHPSLVFELASALRRFGVVNRSLVESAEPSALRRLEELEPGITALRILFTSAPPPLELLEETATLARGVVLPQESVDAGVIAQAHGLGLEVITFTVNEPEEMEEQIGLGVDGLVTDFPDRLDDVLLRLYRDHGAPVS